MDINLLLLKKILNKNSIYLSDINYRIMLFRLNNIIKNNDINKNYIINVFKNKKLLNELCNLILINDKNIIKYLLNI
jgi:hypothetical protein